eukprot:Nitzschia sp. Nitz4//scaffold42_size132992//38795//40678//NITZ4_003388-RA/size132992-processed-gene-0.31-mRNA-1//-1//CDS//3329551685//2598//frame0
MRHQTTGRILALYLILGSVTGLEVVIGHHSANAFSVRGGDIRETLRNLWNRNPRSRSKPDPNASMEDRIRAAMGDLGFDPTSEESKTESKQSKDAPFDSQKREPKPDTTATQSQQPSVTMREEQASTPPSNKEQTKPAKKSELATPTFVHGGTLNPTAMSAPRTLEQTTVGAGPPVSKESVVMEATTADIQKMVIESPVPVILDIYRDGCKPCEVLGPILEKIALQGKGRFRVVKVHSSNEPLISAALEITAVPTLFGIRDGTIVQYMQGMPKSAEVMQSFLMVTLGEQPPNLDDATQTSKFQRWSTQLMRRAGSASFSFGDRERLTDKTNRSLKHMSEADGQLLRKLIANVVRDPTNPKFRTINLENPKLSQLVAQNGALAILRSVGFVQERKKLLLGPVNLSGLVLARDTIDKWLPGPKAKAVQPKKKVSPPKTTSKVTAAFTSVKQTPSTKVKKDKCSLKVRLNGKNRVHELELSPSAPISAVLDALELESTEDVQIVCAAKRLVVHSSNTTSMALSLTEHGLTPSASLVVQVGHAAESESKPRLSERPHPKKSKGSHTMQSVGIYAKDDQNKAELIDGGGGVWYEHDVSDDDDDKEKLEDDEKSNDESSVDEDANETSDDDEL